MLGGWYQLARHRPSAMFVIGSSVMLALLAVAAFGVSATMPLDVAVDDHGVRGAARAWSCIRRFHVKSDHIGTRCMNSARTHIELDCEAGPILLGPGTPDVMEERLAASIGAHLGP
jgi:hypothetical protein